MDAELIVFSGNANRPLAEKICDWLDMPLGEAVVSQFADGETRVELNSNVRGRDVFIVQSLSRPANQHLMEAMIMADAAHRASAARVTLVAPYFGYARQERKSAPRTPISAKLVADLLQTANFNRVLTLELHTSAIQGFFNIAVDHLYAKPIFSTYFRRMENLVVVSPDAGGVERARAMAKHFNCGLAIVDKRRDKPNESAVMNIIGDVKGKNCLIIDDIVDTAGSLTKAADALFAAGGLSVRAAISHPVLSGPAIENLERSKLEELVVTDSIQLPSEAKKCSKITQLSIAELMGKAIRRIHNDDSISALFI
ncbi:MAG: ribose-phosphate pyrophosphokinase [Deltaproteobacteria bacterium]|nr:ribose-phosphate pyrophosphokinase [Deltaproteobacteria bacterium]